MATRKSNAATRRGLAFQEIENVARHDADRPAHVEDFG